MAKYRVSFDIGGTFTDLVVLDEESGDLRIGKCLTTPHDPAVGVVNGIKRLLELQQVAPSTVTSAVHGATTLVTNTVIERRGAKTGLITTRGFGDTLQIAREVRYDLYDMFAETPEPLVPRRLCKEVEERVARDGEVLVPLDRRKAEMAIDELMNEGVNAIGVCLMHSYRNAVHEQAVSDIIEERAPGIFVTLSSDLIPEIREYERMSTTVMNAYVQPKISEHLHALEETIRELGVKGRLYLMLSSGGIIAASTAAQSPVKLIESGPAAGALAATFYGKLVHLDNILSFDMGGTTAKACLVNQGKPTLATEFEAARVHRFKKGSGLPIKVPVIDLIEIGAGGGSIAHIDRLGLLKVGPESAGADPGPACYGLGGTGPTVTDADLVLGYLDPGFFVGGEMALYPDLAYRAIEEKIARPLGISVVEAACGILRVVNENMATAAKIHIAEHGKDPRVYTLMAFGGAGPVHAYEVARKLQVKGVVSPLAAGALSAIGLLVAPLAMDFVHSYVSRLEGIDWTLLRSMYADMEERGFAALEQAGMQRGDILLSRSVDMRYVGQGHEISVPMAERVLDEGRLDDLKEEFYETYATLFGRAIYDVPIEALNWRVVVSAQPLEVSLKSKTDLGPLSSAIKGVRKAYFPEVGQYVEAIVYDHYRLSSGAEFRGPAIIEQRESTTIVGPNDSVEVDPFQNLVIHLNVGE